MSVLAIRDLTVRYGARVAVDAFSLEVAAGEIVALVGESGSGKSTVAAAAIGLLPADAVVSGDIRVGERSLLDTSERERDALRGSEVAMVFQEPRTALNPLMRSGAQVAEVLRLHRRLGRRAAQAEATATLERVGLTATQARRFPHQLSGGQRQRVAIAIAIAAGPKLLIADEPTTALDVTIQAQILALLRALVEEQKLGLLLISHDLPLVARFADRVVMMRDGAAFEQREALPPQVIATKLVRAETVATPLLEVRGLVREYRSGWLGRDQHRVLDDVSFAVARGETVGVIGESGAGKTSLLHAVLALDRPQAGDILVNGESIVRARGATLRHLRRQVQAVFQDPAASLDPRQRVGKIIAEPLHLLDQVPHGKARRAMVETILGRVGLSPADADRFPHQFSGGQRQRIAIARALILDPALVVLDEAVSALDASLRGEILALLAAISAQSGTSYLFVSHDLAMMRAVADRLIVMKDGRIVEQGLTADIIRAPSHPYTAALLAAADYSVA